MKSTSIPLAAATAKDVKEREHIEQGRKEIDLLYTTQRNQKRKAQGAKTEKLPMKHKVPHRPPQGGTKEP